MIQRCYVDNDETKICVEQNEKKIACEHDKHLNATDGTVQNAHTQKCYCIVFDASCFRLRFIIFQSECMYNKSVPYHAHTYTILT